MLGVVVLQCIAVCCSVLQCDAVCCGVLQCVAVYCSVLQCVAVCWSVVRMMGAVGSVVLQLCCSSCVAAVVLQHVAVWCCSKLQCGWLGCVAWVRFL